VSIDSTNGHPDMDYAEHNRTYAGFIQFTKIAIITSAIVLFGMWLFLV
jgi:hypothetical protein